MTQHALGSDGKPSDAPSHKDSGRGAGKAGIPGYSVVYTGLIRDYGGEREGWEGKGGSDVDGSDSKQC
ncbi:hypothetical protein PBY51_007997 [Eleginops maclovinus]|uniref:Uncharacterized protein n=1 Tax=Eleginops maclovinus TaxID=56733 RepID=A0AAN7X7H0_ELEMC|nr:hypothetical protein PBY51_007997 [Eleginops maclovinus]